jgi:hypothetical protein
MRLVVHFLTPPLLHFQARDSSNQIRTTGGDEFQVVIKNTDGVQMHADFVDNNDGTYVVHYTAPVEDTYTIDVNFLGTFGGNSGTNTPPAAPCCRNIRVLLSL